MGRRSINTTKSGKYMNPTDQARKEARKQELKKNKKQRQMVRAAVLKGKDPQQILEEMEKIDQMEFNVDQPSPLNEKVLKDKRKKLKDTLDRVLGMYYKDDPDKWTELKKRQTEYECKKAKLVAFFDSVKSAQSVTVDEIPLPQLPQQATANSIPLPTLENKKPEVPIYSIATALKLQAFGQPIREPPGCPPGPPPDLNDNGEVIEYAFKHADMIEEDRIVEDTSIDGESLTAPDGQQASKPTSLQQKMVALSGQNVDEFIKEMETVQKKLEQRKEQDQTKLASQMEQLLPPGTTDSLPNLASIPPTNPPPIVPPPLIFTGPGIRLPPGPPPGRPLLPPGPPPGLPPIRLSVGPRLIRIPAPPLLPIPQAQPQPVPQLKPNVLTAGPQLINRSESTKQGATISAKPQIRNLSADVTRFVPSALRVKREERKNKPVTTLVRELKQKEMNLNNHLAAGQHTKDDAYKQFMEEMENLM
ncbi:WW domain-binding protein 11 [Anthonomus grandis grandis]|uniref:WW domain-binding protein 11 n=1 Tax=Anthonomus grandis grandis TaxID=2921223 RepID=UPI002165DF29|nr:WW domain-binding protein 11 [Anthonomus grandis grandis]XP_050303876.1 WW domain-binding protein 11 [Anthonomus grandis grandis]